MATGLNAISLLILFQIFFGPWIRLHEVPERKKQEKAKQTMKRPLKLLECPMILNTFGTISQSLGFLWSNSFSFWLIDGLIVLRSFQRDHHRMLHSFEYAGQAGSARFLWQQVSRLRSVFFCTLGRIWPRWCTTGTIMSKSAGNRSDPEGSIYPHLLVNICLDLWLHAVLWMFPSHIYPPKMHQLSQDSPVAGPLHARAVFAGNSSSICFHGMRLPFGCNKFRAIGSSMFI